MHRALICLSLLPLTAPLHAAIAFDSSFESGNGTAFTQVASGEFSFEIEPDTNSDDRQWYFFGVSAAMGETLTFRLQDIDQTNVPEHWPLAVPVASSDGGETWQPVSGGAAVVSGEFVFTHDITGDPELIAHHYPYTHSRALARIASWEHHPDVTRTVIGQSAQGRDIDLLSITATAGDPADDRLGFWIICREHAAEVTGSWMLEGFMDFLLSDDPRARTLRQGAVTHAVPMLNPDGAALGNYRDNALGGNLNVAWSRPAPEECPEVAAVIAATDAWVDEGHSYDFFASLHSSSAVTFNWAYRASDLIKPPLAADPVAYSAALENIANLIEANAPDFLASQGLSHSRRADVSRQFQMFEYGALSLLFEGTYCATSYGPHEGEIMTPARHAAIGRALGIALHDHFFGAE